MASERIFIAVAINIIEIPDLIRFVDSVMPKYFVANELFFGIEFRAFVIMARDTPIANNDLAIPTPSNSDIFLNDDERSETAAAMPTSDQTLTPLVNDCSDSLTESRMSPNLSFKPSVFFLSNSFSNIPLILSTRPPSFLASINMPPPASPAKMSPAEMFSRIHPNTFVTAPHILPATLQMVPPTEENIFPKPLNPSTAIPRPFDIPETILESIPENPPESKLSFKDVKKSPIFAVMLSSESPTLEIPSDPANCAKALNIDDTIFLPISRIEKNPLKVLLILSIVSLLISICSVKLLNLSVKEYT